MNRNFVLLLQGQFVSRLGTQIAITATVFWLRQHTGSASLVGLLLALCSAPTVLLGPLGGTFADRHSRIGIMVGADLICGAAMLILSALAFVLAASSSVAIGSILAVNVLVASAQAFLLPAAIATLPDIVSPHRLAWGMSLSQSSVAVATIAGQALGGFLLPFGAPLLFLFDGLSYLFTAAAEASIAMPAKKRPRLKSSGRMRFRDDVLDGFRYIWSRPALRQLFLTAIPLNVLVVPIFVLLPFYTTDVLRSGGGWYGYLMAAVSTGSLAGYVLGGFARRLGKVLFKVLCSCVLLTSLVLGLLGWTTVPWITLAMLAVLGLLIGWVSITTATILQQGTQEEARGRVFGLLLTLSQGLTPIAMFLTGLLADLTGNNIRLIYSVSGAGSLLLTATLIRSSNLKTFFDEVREDPHQEARMLSTR